MTIYGEKCLHCACARLDNLEIGNFKRYLARPREAVEDGTFVSDIGHKSQLIYTAVIVTAERQSSLPSCLVTCHLGVIGFVWRVKANGGPRSLQGHI